MNRYLFFTEDKQLISQLREVFVPRQIQIKPTSEFPSVEKENRLVVVDGDCIPPRQSLENLSIYKRKKIPVVYLFSDLSGRNAVEILNKGVVAVLFKDYGAIEIKKQLKDILFNFNYLEKVKKLAENDFRTKKFLGIVNSMTSDNDINAIMNHILKSMVQVFQLAGTTFFIVKKEQLIYKLEQGKSPNDYSNTKWSLNSQGPKTLWLEDLQKNKNPLYINKKLKKEYLNDFPVNTLLLPLVIKKKFIGLIAAFFNSNIEKISQSEIDLLQAFSHQTAVALENAKLYWDVLKAQEKLIYQEKKDLLNQAIISLNHEINNPLSIISMEAQLLQQKHKNENMLESKLEKIEQNIERIKKILEKISSLSIENIPLTEYVNGKKMIDLYEH